MTDTDVLSPTGMAARVTKFSPGRLVPGVKV